jgi:CTP synthase (UTP-ammonia lyase)
MTPRIAILGDFHPAYSTHLALNESVKHCNSILENAVICDWIATDEFIPEVVFDRSYSGLWIAPGSPYRSMEKVLEAIRYSRTRNIPTFGNCGGFQHMLIEIARNSCGISNADHAETNPDAEELVIAKLSCALVGQEEEISIRGTDTMLFEILKTEKLIGKYFCSYGVNEKYSDEFTKAGCRFTAFSPDGNIRAFELTSHPFFLGTLFQPALNSSMKQPDPLITAFFRKCASMSI